MRNKTPLRLGAGLLFLAVALLVPLSAAFQDSRMSRGKDVLVPPEAEQTQLLAWGGTVNIEGKVRKDVLVVGSEVTVSGEIGDTFVGFGARVVLKPTAVIQKDLVILGGSLVREDGSVVKGDTIYFKSEELRERFQKGGFDSLFGAMAHPFILIVKFVSLMLWAVLVLVVAGLFPRNVTLAADELRRSFGPALLTGLVATAAFLFLIVFATVLSIILIGIPVLIALSFAAILIKVFGRVVVYYAVGRAAARVFGRTSISPVAGGLLGLAAVGIVRFIPVLGGLLTFFLSLLGWGIALRTKFGMTENWFRRTPPAAPVAPPAPRP